MDNTYLVYALAENKPDTGNIRETFFLSQMKFTHKVISSEKSDFEIDNYTFEIEGQENSKNKYMV
ncbi:hypothetical protein [Bacteroides salyersiae]|uniref:hypothetical protein n=1 Tax=Bacteroides salyersiae TaxID=291644 RepID=UPI002166536D|nr:hypothetical protein [Bacteroides salyersiae]MCS3057449.1 hypothetical protein [Bacteroides salyersiae]